MTDFNTTAPGKEAKVWTLHRTISPFASSLRECLDPEIPHHEHAVYEHVPVVEQAAYDRARSDANIERERADQATKFWEDKTAEWAQQYLDVTAERDRLALRVEELEADRVYKHY